MEIEKVVESKLREVFQDQSLTFDKSRFAGGLTNYNYIMNIHGNEYVIRQPGGMTEHIIDRKMEKVNNSIASEFGVNSDCIYFDDLSGIKISRYITGSVNVAQANPESQHNLNSVCKLLKTIHNTPVRFKNTFDWQQELHKYETIIRQLKGDFFFDYWELKQRLLQFSDRYINRFQLVSCHNDTVPENFLVDSTGRIYLIDWEYSGLNDPCWDVAAYLLESRLSEPATASLLTNYFGRPLTTAEEYNLKIFIMAQDLLWAAWALIRHYNGDDFLDYCYMRYDRFRRNLQQLTASPNCPLAALIS